MEKKSLKKILLSAGLVGVIGVGASLAYFSDVTGLLTNTFDMFGESGQKAVSLQIKENEVRYADGNYVEVPDSWKVEGEGNNYTNLLPGASLWKNPTVVIDPHTAESVVVVKVTGLDSDVFDSIDLKIGENDKWTEVTENVTGEENARYFQYKENVTNSTNEAVPLQPLFTEITIKSEFTNGVIPENPDDIVVKAAAVQAVNVENPVQEAVNLLDK